MSLRPLRLEAAVVTLVPLTILLFSFGSGSIPSLQRIGVHWRWVGLITLAVVGAFAVLRRAPATRLPPAFFLLGVLVALGAVSTAWSVDGHLTFERTFTIAALFTAGYGIATLGNRPQAAARMVLGSVLAGAVAVAIASLVAVVFVRHEAIQPATNGAGWRFQGVGQNPNTVPMLLAVTYPLALGGVLSTRGWKRCLLVAAFLLMAGEVAVSGSRGALIAGTAGVLVVAIALGGTWRRRGFLVAAILLLAAACVGANKLQGSPAPVVTAAPSVSSSGQVQHTRGIDGETVFRLEDELGHPPLGAYRPPVPRTLLGSSGRAQAWVGAFKQGTQRPVDGYGFGMEEKVFVDRFYAFEGGFVENSYLSMFLQLGGIGVAAFIALILFLAKDGLRACRATSIATRAPAAAAAGALLAGVTVGMTQSGLLAVGNIASVGLWLSVLCLPTLAEAARR
jgi:O-antigen ligase